MEATGTRVKATGTRVAVTTASGATGDSAVTSLAATLHDHLALRLGVSKWLTVSSRTFVEGSMDSVYRITS